MRFGGIKEAIKLGVALTGSGLYLLGQGPFIENYVNYKKSGTITDLFSPKPVPGTVGEHAEISDDLRRLINETMDEMLAMDKSLKKDIEFLTINSLKPWVAGVTGLSKLYVALPDYLNITSASQLRANKLNELLKNDYEWQMTNDDLWFSPPGRLLISSLILSDQAKKYFIAREIGSVSNTHAYYHALIIFTAIYMYYMAEWFYETTRKIKIAHLPLSSRIGATCMCMVGAVSFYVVCKLLMVDGSRQRNGDAFALTLGLKTQSDLINDLREDEPRMIDDNYYQGAIELYSKIIDRNLSLKTLMKELDPFYTYKHAIFTTDGDERTGLISPHISITERYNQVKKYKHGTNKPLRRLGDAFLRKPVLEKAETEEEKKVKEKTRKEIVFVN